jgi:hypothetical protein
MAAAAQTRSYLLRSGSHHRALGRPFFRLEPLPVFHHARLDPFQDQVDEPVIPDPMPDEPFQVIMPYPIEETPDV